MGAFDQSARFAAHADPTPVVQRLLRPTGLSRTFREWLDTRTIPLPGGPDRTADLVAALNVPVSPEQPEVTDPQEQLDVPVPPEQPTLLILEFQSEHDPDKLDVTLEEVAILRCRARHGEDRQEKYKVLAGFVYLQGLCPDPLLDMTLPGGYGTRHAPLVWNVEEDNAADALEAVASGQLSWGTLFWIPLMAGGDQDHVITRWKEVVTQVTADRRTRGNLGMIALVFAELVKRRIQWKRGLEDFDMTESEVVNEWIIKGALRDRRDMLLRLLSKRFPGQTSDQVIRLINEQESLDLLAHWFDAAAEAATYKQFMEVLKK